MFGIQLRTIQALLCIYLTFIEQFMHYVSEKVSFKGFAHEVHRKGYEQVTVFEKNGNLYAMFIRVTLVCSPAQIAELVC